MNICIGLYNVKNIFYWFFLVLLLQLNVLKANVDKSIMCTSEYCKDFIDDDKCVATSNFCDSQNATHSGILLPSPTLCNCCPYCLANLLEEEICSEGSLGTPPSGDICGPGLYCTSAGDDARCLRMQDSKCHDDQDDYDERRELGTLGFLEQRPVCDDEGKYGPVKCNPAQTCFCVSKTGERIYGEVINEQSVDQKMNCECSRKVNTMENLLDRSEYGGPRCLNDGSFDRLQCIEKRCFCVFNETGLLSSNVIIDLDTQQLTALPCYNKDMNYNPTEYFRKCEKERNELLSTLAIYKHNGYGYLGNPLPRCQPDGNYYKIQIIDNYKKCVTPDGELIENFQMPLDKSDDMNCNCARTRHLLKSAMGTHTIPSCCQNGNWKKIQCRKNHCYCVDQNGSQIGKEEDVLNIEDLDCYNKNPDDC